jgi:DNA-binding MarR family transcriptional regulator
MLTKKQTLILFLIYSKPGIRGIYTLVKIFNIVDFPANMKENLDPLIEKNLIIVFENFDNGTPKNYQITEEGEKFLFENFNDVEIIDYIKTMDEPELLIEVVEKYIVSYHFKNK